MDNSAFSSGSSKKATPRYANDSILESLRSLGSGIGKAVTKDLASKVGNDAFSSVVGGPKKQGELRPNAPVDMRAERAPFPGYRRPEIQQRAPFVAKEEPRLKEQIEAVRLELKALASSISSLNVEIEKAVNEVPVTPGVYHKNFFDRLRSVIRLLKEQVEDSRSWLSLYSNKKQKKQYWGMYKKHGTSFGLSHERTMATQAG